MHSMILHTKSMDSKYLNKSVKGSFKYYKECYSRIFLKVPKINAFKICNLFIILYIWQICMP